MAGLDVYESTFGECRPGSRLRARVKMRVVRTNVECNKHSLQWRHTATSAAVQFSYIEQLSQKGQNISNLRNSSAVFANTIIVAKRGSCACGPESSCASQDATSFFNLMVGKSANLKSKALREFCEDVNKISLQVSAPGHPSGSSSLAGLCADHEWRHVHHCLRVHVQIYHP